MTKFIQRAKVLASTFVTYAVLASTVVAGGVATLQANGDIAGVESVAAWGLVALTWLGAAIKIARSVTLVPDDLVGLLLPEEPDPYAGVDDIDDPNSYFWKELD